MAQAIGGGHPDIIPLEIHPDGKIVGDTGGIVFAGRFPIFIVDAFSHLFRFFYR